MSTTDSQLVQRCLEGNLDAFSGLVREYQNAVYGLALSYVRDFDIAQDLAQEAFIKVYLQLSALKDPSRFGSYLRTTVANLSRSYLARRRFDKVSVDQLDENQVSAFVQRPKNPSELYEQKELREEVMEAIGRLSEKNRQVVALYYIDGLSCREVGDFLGISVAVVKQRLHRARKSLKEEMMEMVDRTLKKEAPKEDFSDRIVEICKTAIYPRSEGKIDEVIKICEGARQLDPQNPFPYAGLGNAYAEKGEWDRALLNFEMFLKLAFSYKDYTQKAKLPKEELLLEIHRPAGKDSVFLHNVIQEVLEIVQPKFEGIPVVVEKDFFERFPAVIGDPVNLRRAFLYIIENALEAVCYPDIHQWTSARHGENAFRKITLALSLREKSDNIAFSCTDNGVGLPHPWEETKEKIEEIADGFVNSKHIDRKTALALAKRARPRTPEEVKRAIFCPGFTTKGIHNRDLIDNTPGFGLYFSRYIVWKHGGTITVDDNAPRGTVFTVNLPIG